MGGLFFKEFKEHRFAFLFFTLIQFSLFLLFLIMFHLQPGRGSYFYVFRAWLMLGASLGVFYLSNRLIAREFNGKTQLFLESLPVSRSSI